jgi:hypothetical protein
VGFRHLAPNVEYISLHDVDWVPVEADYRWPERPMMIIRHGLRKTVGGPVGGGKIPKKGMLIFRLAQLPTQGAIGQEPIPNVVSPKLKS